MKLVATANVGYDSSMISNTLLTSLSLLLIMFISSYISTKFSPDLKDDHHSLLPPINWGLQWKAVSGGQA